MSENEFTPTTEQVRADRDAVSLAIGRVLFNVSNFPEAAQTRLLGQDMKPLNDKLTDAVLASRSHAVQVDAHSCAPGVALMKLDGGRRTLLCAECRRVIGYAPDAVPVDVCTGDTACAAGVHEDGCFSRSPVGGEQ